MVEPQLCQRQLFPLTTNQQILELLIHKLQTKQSPNNNNKIKFKIN